MDEQREPGEVDEQSPTSEATDEHTEVPPPLPHEQAAESSEHAPDPDEHTAADRVPDEHADDPAVDEPAVDDPAVDEPTVDESTVEEADADEFAAVDRVPDDHAAEPTVDEPAVDEPAVDEPAVDEPTVEEADADEFAAVDRVPDDHAAEPVSDPDATTVRPAVIDPGLTPPPGAIDSEAEGPPAFSHAAAGDEGAADYQLYRSDSTETRSVTTPTEPAETSQMSQEEILAAERAERKAARDKALGNVARSPEAEPLPPVPIRTTDRFLGSTGLFLLRLIVAGLFGLRGVQHLTNLADTNTLISGTWLAEYLDPSILAIVLGAGELLIALALVLGLLVRVAGFGVTAIAVMALVFVHWGVENPFGSQQFGFVGEYELLLAGVGVLFMCLGGGGWAIDRSFRKSRQARKDERDSV